MLLSDCHDKHCQALGNKLAWAVGHCIVSMAIKLLASLLIDIIYIMCTLLPRPVLCPILT